MAALRSLGRRFKEPRLRTTQDDAAGPLAVYLGVLLITPSALGIPVLGSAGAPATLLAAALFLWWGWDAVARDRFIVGSFRGVERLALFLGLAVLVSYCFAMARPIPLDEVSPADSGLIRMVGFLGVILVASSGLRAFDSLRRLAELLILLMGSLTLLAFVQLITGEVWIDRLQIPGLRFGAAPSLLPRSLFNRPSATSTHPLEYGALVGMALPLALSLALSARKRRGLYIATTLSLGLMSLLTFSRTTLIATGLGLAVMLALVPGRWRWWAPVVGGGGLMGAGIVLPGLWGTLVGLFAYAGDDPSIASRTDSYPVVLEHFAHFPLVGRGYGTFLPKYWILDNLYLTLLLDIGIVGLAAVIALMAVAVVSAWGAQRRTPPGPDRVLLSGLTASMAAGAVIPLFFDVFTFAQTAGVLVFLIGLCGAARRLRYQETPT